MTDENWDKKNVKVDVGNQKKGATWMRYASIGVIVIILAVLTWMVVKNDGLMHTNRTCCEKICGELNQQCRGWTMDTLQCTYNYARFGYPWITEVFTFQINETVKDQLCSGNITMPKPLPAQAPEVTVVNATK